MLSQVDGYLHAMVPGAVIAAVVYAIAYRPRMRALAGRGLRSGRGREAVLLLFAMYACGMALLTLTPTGFDLFSVLEGDWQEPFFSHGAVSTKLFRTLRYDRLIFWGNVVMFLPFGFLPAVLWRGSRWYRALAIAIGVTLTIECWQLCVGRTFDVDDLLLNACGAMCGWLLWLLLGKPALYCEELT